MKSTLILVLALFSVLVHCQTAPPGCALILCPTGTVCREVNGQAVCDRIMCPAIWKPVCGKDGKTYSSSCHLSVAGVAHDYEGECKKATRAPTQPPVTCAAVLCPTGTRCRIVNNEPVCDRIMCPAVYQPVCGKDGKTYGNSCHLGAAGVEYHHDGECVTPTVPASCAAVLCLTGTTCRIVNNEPVCEPIVCPAIYQPVCGKDGKTYGNNCLLGAAGVEYHHDGECATPTVPEAIVCPAIYKPVCGKDGKTYGNSCLLGAAGVEHDYDGECKKGTPSPRNPATEAPVLTCATVKCAGGSICKIVNNRPVCEPSPTELPTMPAGITCANVRCPQRCVMINNVPVCVNATTPSPSSPPLLTCEVVDCMPGHYCIMKNNRPVCVKTPGPRPTLEPEEPRLTCANVRCMAGYICRMVNGNPVCEPTPTPSATESPLITCDNVRCATGTTCVMLGNPPSPVCDPIMCPMHYSPVCGKDGKTYGNSCLLGVAGVELDHTGACENQATSSS